MKKIKDSSNKMGKNNFGKLGGKIKVVSFSGGLGNQMFEYAFYKKHTKDTKVVLADCSHYNKEKVMPYVLEDVFPNVKLLYDNESVMTQMLLEKYKKRNIIQKIMQRVVPFFRILEWEKADGVYDSHCMKRWECLYKGYWQCEKYWSDIADEIQEDFTFAPISDKKINQFAEDLLINETVSVHVRRGDYLSKEGQKLFGNICTIDYYNKAIHYIKNIYPKCKFVFFSDDPEWVKQNFHISNMMVVSNVIGMDYPDWYDMYLMACCKHHIIANSSFSWWGAYLGHNISKTVIAPSKWMNGKSNQDIWVDGWIRL